MTKIFIILSAVVALLGIYALLNYTQGSEEHSIGVIHDANFNPSTESTGVAYMSTSKGGTVGIVHTGHPDEYSLIVQIQGKYFSMPVDVNTYYSLKHGDTINVHRRIGKWTEKKFDWHIGIWGFQN